MVAAVRYVEYKPMSMSSHASTSIELSISFVSWINDELRTEIHRRESLVQSRRPDGRLGGLVIASISGLSLAVVRFFTG